MKIVCTRIILVRGPSSWGLWHHRKRCVCFDCKLPFFHPLTHHCRWLYDLAFYARSLLHTSHLSCFALLKRRHKLDEMAERACVCHHVSLNYIFFASSSFSAYAKQSRATHAIRWLHFLAKLKISNSNFFSLSLTLFHFGMCECPMTKLRDWFNQIGMAMRRKRKSLITKDFEKRLFNGIVMLIDLIEF